MSTAAAAATPTADDAIALDAANRWRFFVCNAFLIPDAYCDHLTVTCTLQHERAAGLGRMVRKHQPDVVLLQELWGVGHKQLEEALSLRGKGASAAAAAITPEGLAAEVEAALSAYSSSSSSSASLASSFALKASTMSALEALYDAHVASAEPYHVPQPDGRGGGAEGGAGDNATTRPFANDKDYGERVARRCKNNAVHTTDATMDPLHGLYYTTISAPAATSADPLKKPTLNTFAQFWERAVEMYLAGGQAMKQDLATSPSAPPLSPLHLRIEAFVRAVLPPRHYAIPAMMRSFYGSDAVDTVVQYLTQRGGLVHAHNDDTVLLLGGMGGNHTTSANAANSTVSSSAAAAAAARYFPLLCMLKDGGGGTSEGRKAFLRSHGCGGLATILDREEAKQKRLAAAAASSNTKRLGDATNVGTADTNNTNNNSTNAAADADATNPPPSGFSAVAVRFVTRQLTALLGSAAVRRAVGAMVPTYPRHHRYAVTDFPSHNKSVMVMKAVKRRATATSGGASLSSAAASSSSSSSSSTSHPLLFFNTHLDPLNKGPTHRIIERQLIELKAFICDVIEKEMAMATGEEVNNNKSSSAPSAAGDAIVVRHLPMAAVIAGDFNIAAKQRLHRALGADTEDDAHERDKDGDGCFVDEGLDHPNDDHHSYLYHRLFEIMGNGEMCVGVDVDGDGGQQQQQQTPSTPAAAAAALVASRIVKSSVSLKALLSPSSLAIHTYCRDNVMVQHPSDEGRLDHIFAVESVTLTVLGGEGEVGEGGSSSGSAPPQHQRTFTIKLLPVALAYERVLNNHLQGDALLSDHYPFVADIIVGGGGGN